MHGLAGGAHTEEGTHKGVVDRSLQPVFFFKRPASRVGHESRQPASLDKLEGQRLRPGGLLQLQLLPIELDAGQLPWRGEAQPGNILRRKHEAALFFFVDRPDFSSRQVFFEAFDLQPAAAVVAHRVGDEAKLFGFSRPGLELLPDEGGRDFPALRMEPVSGLRADEEDRPQAGRSIRWDFIQLPVEAILVETEAA